MHIDSFKKLTKSCLATILCKARINTILPRIFAKRHTPIIIYYHRVSERENGLSSREITVSVEAFEKQIEFLKSNFSVLPLNVVVDRMKNKSITSFGELAITFDDGYIDNYRQAYPILKKYGVPATIFVTTGYIGTNRLFWWDKLHEMVKVFRNGLVDWESMPADLFSEGFKDLLKKHLKRRISFTAITNYLKRVGTTKRDNMIAYLERECIPSGLDSSNSRLFLTWEEIREMYNNGITFGSHSHTHPVLTELCDDDVLQELTHSKTMIEEAIGSRVRAFAYPDGWFDDRVKQLVESAGFECAFQTSRRIIQGEVDLFAIPRKMVKEAHSKGYFSPFSAPLFYMELSGTLDKFFLRAWRKENPYEVEPGHQNRNVSN